MATLTNLLSYFSIAILLTGVFLASLKLVHWGKAQVRIGKLRKLNRNSVETLTRDIRVESEKEAGDQSAKNYVSPEFINHWFDGILVSDITDVRDIENILRAIGRVRGEKGEKE